MSTTTPPPRDGNTWDTNPERSTEADSEHLAGAPGEAGPVPVPVPDDPKRGKKRDMDDDDDDHLQMNRKKKRDMDDDDDDSLRPDDHPRVMDRKKKRDPDDDDDDHLRPDDRPGLKRKLERVTNRDTDENDADQLGPDDDDDHLWPDDHRDTKSKIKRGRNDDDHERDGDPAGGVTVTPSSGGGPTVRDPRDTSGTTVRDDEVPVTPQPGSRDQTVRDHRGPDDPPPRADGGPTVRDFDDIVGDDIQEMPAASLAGGIGDPGDTTPVGNAQMDIDDWETESVTAASDADGTDNADAYAFGSAETAGDESSAVTPDDGDPAIGDAEVSEQLD